MDTKRIILEKFLEKNPEARERSRKDRAIVHVLLQERHRKTGFDEVFPSTKDSLVQFVKDYASMDRSWRQILEQRPELRGRDYNDKPELQRQKRIELGYNS